MKKLLLLIILLLTITLSGCGNDDKEKVNDIECLVVHMGSGQEETFKVYERTLYTNSGVVHLQYADGDELFFSLENYTIRCSD